MKTLHIKNYGIIKDLKIDNLKKINVFVGENGVGKTQILHRLNEEVGSVWLMNIEIQFIAYDDPFEVNYSKIILVDEIERGIYYKNYKKVLKKLLEICELYDAQMFITTHSYEMLIALDSLNQEMENKDNIMVYRIKDGKVAAMYNSDDFHLVIEERMEVR